MRVTRLLDVPHVVQLDEYDCGPAALAAVLAFHDVPATLAELTPLADPNHGTPPDVLVTEIRRRGLEVEFGSYSPRQLRQRIRADEPVLVCLQAWDASSDDDGHWCVVKGFTRAGLFVLEDPSEDEDVVLTEEELLDRWHDRDGDGVRYERFGVVVRLVGD